MTDLHCKIAKLPSINRQWLLSTFDRCLD